MKRERERGRESQKIVNPKVMHEMQNTKYYLLVLFIFLESNHERSTADISIHSFNNNQLFIKVKNIKFLPKKLLHF